MPTGTNPIVRMCLDYSAPQYIVLSPNPPTFTSVHNHTLRVVFIVLKRPLRPAV